MKRPSSTTKNVKPLRVGLVYDDSLDGSEGVAQQVKLIGVKLAAAGHEVTYFSGQTTLTEYGGGRVYSLAKNIKVSFNGNKLSIPLPSRRRRLKQALAARPPEVLHVQMPHSPFLAQRLVNLAPKAAVVGTFHIYPANWQARLGAKLLRRLYLGGLAKFNIFTCVSSAAQAFARDSFKIDCRVIPNAVDLAALASTVSNTENTIVFLGRLVERKGCAQLIQAFGLVHQRLPETKLIIGGRGPEQAKLMKLVDSLGLTDAVRFEGFIDEERKADFLAQASVACFPSLYGESFGLVLAEAMAAGAGAVLAGDNPGYASVLADRPELLCDPTDTAALADKLEKLLSDKTYRANVTAWQKSYVKKFDIDSVVGNLEAVYLEAIAKKTKSRHN